MNVIVPLKLEDEETVGEGVSGAETLMLGEKDGEVVEGQSMEVLQE